MSFLKFSLVFMLFLVMASQYFASVTVAEVGEGEAASALDYAEGAVVSAYHAVLEAENAGANVSGLLVRLNEVGAFLTQARIAYRLRDFDSVDSFAGSSMRIAVEVQNEAVELKNAALSEGIQRMLFTMTASVVGVASIVSGSLWIWRVLKKRYGQASVH